MHVLNLGMPPISVCVGCLPPYVGSLLSPSSISWSTKAPVPGSRPRERYQGPLVRKGGIPRVRTLGGLVRTAGVSGNSPQKSYQLQAVFEFRKYYLRIIKINGFVASRANFKNKLKLGWGLSAKVKASITMNLKKKKTHSKYISMIGIF